jgi:hypothetical protein
MRCLSLARSQAQRVVFAQYGGLASAEFGKAFGDIGQQGGAVHDVQALFERLQILDADDDRGRMPVLGDDYPAVLTFQAVYNLREPVLHVGQGHLLKN